MKNDTKLHDKKLEIYISFTIVDDALVYDWQIIDLLHLKNQLIDQLIPRACKFRKYQIENRLWQLPP
jgi:hypothetical protein